MIDVIFLNVGDFISTRIGEKHIEILDLTRLKNNSIKAFEKCDLAFVHKSEGHLVVKNRWGDCGKKLLSWNEVMELICKSDVMEVTFGKNIQ